VAGALGAGDEAAGVAAVVPRDAGWAVGEPVDPTTRSSMMVRRTMVGGGGGGVGSNRSTSNPSAGGAGSWATVVEN